MTEPSTSDLFRALDETWPPARILNQSKWTLRQGAGGGQRVSAATANGLTRDTDIPIAEAGMRALTQHPLFMLRPGEDALDQALEARNYEVVDPVAIYLLKTGPEPVRPSNPLSAIWPPTAAACSLWEKGGIGPARIAVMERAKGQKAVIVQTEGQTCLGVAFVAISGDIAMLHALEVSPNARRRGIGTNVMQEAAHWAHNNGAPWLSLMVTRANIAANALYRRLGMVEVGKYHYRRATQAKP